MLVYFWSTKCPNCAGQFHDLETTYPMYRLHSFTLVTVATDPPAGTPTETQFLHEQYASGPNMQFASADRGGLEAAFGAKWNSNAPFTIGLAPDGKVLYQKEGKFRPARPAAHDFEKPFRSAGVSGPAGLLEFNGIIRARPK